MARPNDIPFSDLLRLLDPYGGDVSAPSRYYDKAICAAFYYITTPYSLIGFYRKIMGEGWKEQTDGFSQLLRRLSLVLMMTNDEIQSMEYDAQSCKFHPVPGAVRENSYQKKGEGSRESNAKAILGKLLLTEVKPMHCKAFFNSMTGTYAGSTIRQAYIALGAVFKAAKENGLIEKHPMDGVRFDSPVKAVDEITTLSNLISADTRRSRFHKSRGAYFLKISHFDTCVLT